MALRGLGQRVAELEQQVAELQQRVAAPDWRRALGMFTDRPERLEGHAGSLCGVKCGTIGRVAADSESWRRRQCCAAAAGQLWF
jgi:hypothetical protein